MSAILTAPAGPLTDGVVTLRLLDEHDLGAILEASNRDRDYWWAHTRPPYTGEQVRARFAEVEAARAAGRKLTFAIVEAQEGRVAGTIGLTLERDAVAEAWYWVFASMRGRGLATRALRLLSAWALRELGIARLWLEVEPGNEPSLRVAAKNGYVREGVFRSHCETHGRRHDCVILSLLPGDLAA